MSSRHRFPRRLVLTAAFLCVAVTVQAESGTDRASEPMDTLVTTEWLSEHLGAPDLVVLDCTVKMEMQDDGGLRQLSGRADYDGGHIPTAGFADLTGELSDPDSPLNYAVPEPERFRAAMSALGIGDGSRVVLYDSYGSVWAARVWWMLRWIGFDRAALLDGGLRAWRDEERPLSTEPSARPAGKLTVHLRPGLIADRDEVFAAIGDDGVVLIDAMPEAHFKGAMAMYDRPGHIPGALNVPALALLDATGHYRPAAELAAMCEADRTARIVTYCGGGIAASSTAFVLTRLGYPDVAVYTASLQEWTADPDNPLVVEP
jgi:thiosulfate/3-mercaptopyruvate sulfurtransferase